jgi:hypothetical protein
MGAFQSVVSAPADASDIVDLGTAKAEISKLRAMIKDNLPKQLDRSNMPKNRAGRQSTLLANLNEEMYEKFANVIGPRGYTFDASLQCAVDSDRESACAIPGTAIYMISSFL